MAPCSTWRLSFHDLIRFIRDSDWNRIALFDWCRWDEQEQGACVAGLSDFQNQGPHQRRSNLASLVRVRAVGDSASLRPCKREAA